METLGHGTAVGRLSGLQPSRILIAGAFGNLFEWYDYAVYGILATFIGHAMLPANNAKSVLATFAIFWAGFAMRPFGGIAIGWVGTAYGRKPALYVSLIAMGLGTLMIGLVPSYAKIGDSAPILLLAARMIQSFSAGGEWGIGTSFLAEWAPEGKRGFWTSWVSVSVAVGSFLASASSASIILILDADDMQSWGWRVPFLFGAVLGVFGLWLRAAINETPAFIEAARQQGAIDPSNLRENLRCAFTAIGVIMHWTVCYYVLLIYLPTYIQVHVHLTSVQSTVSNAISLLVIATTIPCVGLLSDRYGRKKFLLCSCLIVFFGTIPALWILVEEQTFPLAIAVQLIFGFANALYSGAAPAVLVELFPAKSRSLWLTSSYAIAATLFGGSAPVISELLIHQTGNALAPAAYVLVASFISFITVLCLRNIGRNKTEARG